MTSIPIPPLSSGSQSPPNLGEVLPGKRPDSHPYDEIYMKDYFVKFLLTRLYGKKVQNAEYTNLNTIVDSNSGCYNLEDLPSKILQNACLNLSFNNFVPRTKLEEDVKKVLGNNELIEKGILGTSIVFEEIIRNFIVQTLGDDLRVPDTSLIDSGRGYDVHTKPVSNYNEFLLVKKLKTEANETSDLVLTRAFNKLVKEKLDQMLASCMVA